MKEITIRGAIGVTSRGYDSGDPADRVAAHARSRRCTRTTSRSRDAEHAIRTLAREIPGERVDPLLPAAGAGADADGRTVARVDRKVALRRCARRGARSEVGEERVRLSLPYAEHELEPGKALHGGVRRVARRDSAGRPSRAPRSARTSGRGTPPRCRSATSPPRSTRSPRARRACCGAARSCASSRSRSRATPASRSRTGLVQVRARFGAAPVELPDGRGDHGRQRPGPMGRDDRPAAVHAALGLAVEHMTGGTSRIVHALAATRTPTPPAACTRAPCWRCSTPPARWRPGPRPDPAASKRRRRALQAQFLAPPGPAISSPTGAASSATASCFLERGRGRERGRPAVFARGTVIYRIVTPDTSR